MDAGDRKQRGIPKLRELLRRQRRESDNQDGASPEIDFIYDDADDYYAEISELYTYTEEVEFILNKDAYERELGKPGTRWMDLSEAEMRSFVHQLLEKIECTATHTRMRAVRTLLYLVQGVFGECSSKEEHRKMTEHNVIFLYKCGVWQVIVQLLNMEIEDTHSATAALRKPAVSLADSTHIRLYISFLYSTIETIRNLSEEDLPEAILLKQTFASELNQPIASDNNPETLPIVLFKMIVRFCAGNSPHFPIRKVLLLLWKTLLVCLGGFGTLEEMKKEARVEAGLPAEYEELEEPTQLTELLELRPKLQSPLPQSPLDSKDGKDIEEDDQDNDDDTQSEYSIRPRRRLRPKVRQKDVDAFLDATRIKFVGFQVRSDRSTLAGLPLPIHEGVDILKNHVYVSLGEVQIKNEEEAANRPFTKGKAKVISTPTEMLYQAMLPNLPQCMIALLKILLAAAPTAKAKSDSLNILSDVLPEEMPTTVLDSMRLGIDVNRHKEIIVKAISGTLILLLKHFKLNHIYQFEYMGQHLVFANCIPLILKFLNQNIASFIAAKNNIPQLDFPNNVIGEPKALTADNLEFDAEASEASYCWRNLYSCINLVRILQKLTKWKHSRTMMLVVFKSAPILKRALKVRHDMLQLYVLKLLKAQTKYLGRNWRKSNMKTMSAIYQKVRHRLNDDWAYGNDLDARPWDFQAEECALRTCVDRFNSQRYGNENQDHSMDPEFTPVDNNLLSVLSTHVELSDEFKTNYEKWLDREVFSEPIDWDRLIDY